MSNTETKTIYRQLGISEDVWIYGHHEKNNRV